MEKVVYTIGCKSTDPVLSVVVPCYEVAGKQGLVSSCLASLSKQTLRDIEVIIVDDGSKDASLRTIADVAQVLHRDGCYGELLSLGQNAGVSVARNAGIKRARGRFIGFLDYDDLWAPQFASKATRILLGRQDIDVVLGGTILYREYGGRAKAARIPIPEDINTVSFGRFCAWHLLNNFPVGMGSAVICRRDLFRRKPNLLMDQALSKLSAEDVSFGFKMLSTRVRPYYMRQPMVVARGILDTPSRSRDPHLPAYHKTIHDFIWNVAGCRVFEIVEHEAPEYREAIKRKVSELNDVFLLQRMYRHRREALTLCRRRPYLWKAWIRSWLATRKSRVLRGAMAYGTWLKADNRPQDLERATMLIKRCQKDLALQ